MAIPLDSIPSLTPAEACAAALRLYGLSGTVTPLPSERDQNFCIGAAAGNFVVKIANSQDAAQLLDLQTQAMRHVATHAQGCRVPRVLKSLGGRDIERVSNPRTGTRHCMRVLGWVEGQVLAGTTGRDDTLYDSIGSGMARLDAALQSFVHPAMHRTLQWDLRHADLAREHIGLLNGAQREQVEALFERWQAIDWGQLRSGVIHGDANDHNLLVEDGRMVGLLDFGDMVHSAVVCDLAIALTYVMLGEREPLRTAARVSRAYHQRYPLSLAEQRVLYPLILSRLATSVCYSAHNRARNPGDPYQVVSEAAAFGLLDRLESHAFDAAQSSICAAFAQ